MRTYNSKNDNYDVALTSAEVYGWPRVVYQYSQTCNINYPSWLDSTNTLTGYKSVANYKSGTQSNGAIFLDVDVNPTNPNYLGVWNAWVSDDGDYFLQQAINQVHI